MKARPNNPQRAGARASVIQQFGENNRYAVWAVHTRFNAVEWFVADIDHSIIRQEPTYEQAVDGLR